ncbi:HGGxSTG domain-containing protein [Paraburkholderia caribensis]|uniref:HGGxSTG domain-containing protein n=1 Tax=Paraburkholderia caribensis TaxID=75105 RepID=A0A9Q6S0L7_9BURK|nr:HGGxSTG domain-containing protein [Paraburkholderia caribensis]MCO4875772.1 hypothetical protein [Paraburkholderia caribensis]PTB28456.1 hypothetical protein C9I56_13195 [Paraburkholderia caribensis]QLB62592.1 hypothetical protein A9O66_09480 [Paraburkholderia caribensis]
MTKNDETPIGGAEKRKLLKAHYAECDGVRVERGAIERAEHKWQMANFVHVFLRSGSVPQFQLPDYPAFPDECSGMTCGAKTRAGTPCKLTSIFANGRCKLHGGMSTGPRTDAGRKRSALNGNVPKTKRTP